MPLNNQRDRDITRSGSHIRLHRMVHRNGHRVVRHGGSCHVRHCSQNSVDRRCRTVEGGGDGGPNNFEYEFLLRYFRLHTDDEDEKRRRRGMMW